MEPEKIVGERIEAEKVQLKTKVAACRTFFATASYG